MKKHRIPMILAALAILGAAPAYAASGTADATATVVTPIGIAKTADLKFASFAAGNGGTVVISTVGARTKTGGVTLISGGEVSAAAFNVTGAVGLTYAITLPQESITISSGANTMTVNLSKSQTTGTIDADGDPFTVGATLTVANGQAAGTYSGSFNVTVDYN